MINAAEELDIPAGMLEAAQLAAEIIADTEEIMREIGMTDPEIEGAKMWAELESFPKES